MLGKRFSGALLLSTLIAVPASSAEVPRRLADVNQKPQSPDLVEFPPLATGFFPLGDRLFFSTVNTSPPGEDGILWSTDGTAEGTTVVSSTICPAPCAEIAPVAPLRGTVLFRVRRGADVYSSEVRYWRTDGTQAGTFPVTGVLRELSGEKLVPGPSPGSEVFYVAGENRIWRIDGTEAGTAAVTGVDPSRSNPYSLMAWAGRLCFLAFGEDESGTLRFGLWCTGGTSEGARFITEVRAHYGDDAVVVSTPSHLFFASGKYGEDLWATDGTPESTRLLHGFTTENPCAGPPAYCPPTPDVNSMVAVDDAVYFQISGANGSEIWSSDGTPDGTRPLTTLPADVSTLRRLGGRWLFRGISGGIWTAGDGFSRPEPLTGCQEGICPSFLEWLNETDPGHLVFVGTDPAHGMEPWVTDGTGAGTRRLADICPGPCTGVYSDGGYSRVVLGNSQGRTWFLAYSDAESDGELWMTDGTSAGTRRIAEYTAEVGFLDGHAYFGLWGSTDAYSSELWTADGSRSGTHQVATLKRIPPGSDPVFVPLGHGTVLFGAAEGERRRLWTSDGTPEGTTLVTGFRGSLFDELTRVGSSYFFPVYRDDPNALREELWRTDGTPSGTRKMINFGTDGSAGTDLAKAWNGKYLFPASSSTTWSYWVSDGTPAGTREIVPPLPGVRFPTGLHPFGSRFLFVARKEGKGEPVPQLFVSDGTLAGTLQLTQIRGTREPLQTEFVQWGRTAFFRINGLDGEPEVWRTDGTPKGTRRAFDLKAAAHLQVFQGSLYLTAALDGSGARGLFRVDDPQGPPVLIAPVSPPYEPDFYGKPAFIPAGGRLFFPGDDSEDPGGRELWVTDGTAAGTRQVLDIRPGPDSSDPDGLMSAGDRVFFATDDGVHGRELWVSDGTAGGTRLVWDVSPGEASSNPQNLTVSGDNLFFAADDGETGQEPWVLRLTPR